MTQIRDKIKIQLLKRRRRGNSRFSKSANCRRRFLPKKSINTKVVHKTRRQRIYKERNPLHCSYAPLKNNFISAPTPMRCGQWDYFIFLSCDAELRKNAASLIHKIWTLFQSHPIAHLYGCWVHTCQAAVKGEDVTRNNATLSSTIESQPWPACRIV